MPVILQVNFPSGAPLATQGQQAARLGGADATAVSIRHFDVNAETIRITRAPIGDLSAAA